MVRVEVVIDAGIVLVAIRILPISYGGVYSLYSSEPPIPGNVQTITRRREALLSCAACWIESGAAVGEVIRKRHLVYQTLHPSRGIIAGPIWIWTENAGGLKISSRARRLHRITEFVDGRSVGKKISVLDTREVSK